MLFVEKFGGSSLAGVERVRCAARLIADTVRAGHSVAAVLSAQGKTTDALLSTAAHYSRSPSKRELDMLLATGEQASVALMAMTLEEMGLPAVSLTGWQAGVGTDETYGDAHIRRLSMERVRRELDEGKVVLIAGFQGVSPGNDITTLGRGGSDTTAVAATDERNARNETMVQRLHDAGYPITMDDLHAAFPGQTVLGRPHIAALLVQRGCIASVPDGMRGLLGRGKEFYVPRYNIPLEDSVRALRAAGGVPVVAHIFKYRFDDAQRTAMLSAAADAGALGVEVRYTTYTPEQAAAAQALAARFGLAPSGGSDYHGLRKPDIALGSGRGGLRVPYAYLAGLKALAGHECV